MGMSLCSPVIYAMFWAILIDIFYTKFIYNPVQSFDYRWNNNVLILKKYMFYIWKFNFVLFMIHFLVNISTAIDKVISMLFSRSRSNADEQTLTQLPFSTKYQRWSNIGWSILNRRNSIDVASMLFPNVETTSINVRRLNFYFQPNINVDGHWQSALFQRWLNVDVFAGSLG